MGPYAGVPEYGIQVAAVAASLRPEAVFGFRHWPLGCGFDGKSSVCRQVKAAHRADRFATMKVCATDGPSKLADTWHHSGSLVLAPQNSS